MKRQSIFSGENKKKYIFKMSTAEMFTQHAKRLLTLYKYINHVFIYDKTDTLIVRTKENNQLIHGGPVSGTYPLG